MRYHVELSPRAEQNIKDIGAPWHKVIGGTIRSILGDPEGDGQHFEIVEPLKGVVVGHVVAVFRFMTPEELADVNVPGRYVIRVAHQDELEEMAGELASELPRSGQQVRAAAEDLLKALQDALRRRP